jgi:hypothetical protein
MDCIAVILSPVHLCRTVFAPKTLAQTQIAPEKIEGNKEI